MANIFDIPLVNPLRFFQQTDITYNTSSGSVLNPGFNPNYNTRQFDADFFRRSLQDWQDMTDFIQPFQQGDKLSIQWIGSDTTTANYVCRVLDCEGRTFSTETITGAAAGSNKRYDVNIPLYNKPEGVYFVQLQHIQTGADLFMISEPIHVKEYHDNTIRLDYYNSYNDQGVIYDTANNTINFSLRIPGDISELTTGSVFVVYEDQPRNLEMIGGKPYRSFKLTAGGYTNPIPEYLADKLERVLICDTLRIEGTYYTREESSKLEKQNVKNNPLSYYTIQLRERYNYDAIEVQQVECIVMGDVPTTPYFFVKEITINGTTYSVQKMFTGANNFLAYLNTNAFFSTIYNSGYFAINSEDKLTFVKYDSYTIANTWELDSADVLSYGLSLIHI